MFDPGIAIPLELIALGVGALVIIGCHHRHEYDREVARLNVFPKFIGYFTVILAFIALIGSLIACFNYWMDMGGTVESNTKVNIEMPELTPDINKIPPPSPTPTPTPSTPTPGEPAAHPH